MDSPKVTKLVLDAGPLLSLAPLRGLSKEYYTVPQVLGELKDEKARSHFQNLGLSAGVKVETKIPHATALAKVTLAAKKSGDYSVLSSADLHVIALTYALHQEYVSEAVGDKEDHTSVMDKDTNGLQKEASELASPVAEEQVAPADASEAGGEDEPIVDQLAQEFERLPLEGSESKTTQGDAEPEVTREEALYDDPSDEDDGQGEWITPQNVALHKSQALNLLPTADSNPSKRAGKRKLPIPEKVDVGCMTTDFAMQNVLLHMGMNLVGVDGKKISSVKSWVLRCHACFKICKDNSKKFCPSCGNPSLLRTSVTVNAPTKPGEQPTMQIHLKSNFQYRTRGTKYSIPMAKPGTSKTGSGTGGLILREDQTEYMKAVEKEKKREQRDLDKLMKATLNPDSEGGSNAGSVKIGDWSDPDWLPAMLVGTDKRRDTHNLPVVGMGKRNPNERRRRK
ncbi:hypothetical protein CPB86DRAFT_874839 [Serendipita vermifera]|nr:hypothetical protein CPB86DRAFT_874839 [Serendipita vermifera]